MDTNCYERQHGGDLEVGSYAHRAILMDADEIPSIAESALSPTELPFTQEDFELQMEQALELVPDILGDERVGIRHAINGLLSLTPDGMPILGETPGGQGPLGGRRDLDQGGPGDRPDGRRVDDRREARDRPPRVGHRPLPRPPEGPPPRQGAFGGGLQQDLRDRPPGRAVVEQPRRPAQPVQQPRARARRRLLRDRRLGAPVLVRLQRAAARGVRRPGHAAPRRNGNRAGGRRSSTPSTSPCATGSAWSTSRRSPSSTSRGRAPSTTSSGWPSPRWTSPTVASSTRRSSTRPAGSSRT